MQEIFDQEKHMDQLSATIRNMGPPLKVAQTRLSLRTSRPEMEACRDRPHHRWAVQILGHEPFYHLQTCGRGWGDSGEHWTSEWQDARGPDCSSGKLKFRAFNSFSFRILLFNYKIKVDPKVEIQRIQLRFDTRALLTIKENSSFQSAVIEIILRLNLNFPW